MQIEEMNILFGLPVVPGQFGADFGAFTTDDMANRRQTGTFRLSVVTAENVCGF